MSTTQTDVKPIPNYELLKDAYAIIGGIPEDKIHLRAIVSKVGESAECGTVCCAAGWLGLHPKFQALGLTTSLNASDDIRIKMRGVDDYSFYSTKLAALFNMEIEEIENLFSPDSQSDYDVIIKAKPSPKQRFLKRVRMYLEEKGQLS